MYNFFIGNIEERFESGVVLNVNNIGYEFFCSNFCLKELDNVVGEIKLYSYYQVKDDGVALFGFYDRKEKDMFLKLITVSGVGPKGAMAILSNVTPIDLAKIIAKQDINAMSSIKGIGKKTAERLLVELKDKVDVLPLEVFDEELVVDKNNVEIADAVEVLVNLGISRNDALKRAQENYKNGDKAEDIISKALVNGR